MNYLRKILFVLFMWMMWISATILRAIFKMIPIRKLRGKSSNKKLLILEIFFPNNAGYHYRSFLWKQYLEKQGIQVSIKTLMNENQFAELLGRHDLIAFHTRNLALRFVQIFSCFFYDTVMVRRSLLPYNDYGMLFLDKLLLSMHDNVILDYDDDLTNNINAIKNRSMFGKLLFENRLIFYNSLALYRRFTPGSNYLKQLLLEKNSRVEGNNVLVLPTCVNYHLHQRKSYGKESTLLTFGWIGSNFNQCYLDQVIPALNELSKKQNLKLLVISGRAYRNDLALFEIENRPWSIESEIENLFDIDIGLMPLDDDKVTRAKCGFKLIQYMGLGIVSVAGAITVNNEIIDHGRNGFLVNNNWSAILEEALKEKIRFEEISLEAVQKIKNHYSFEAYIDKLIEFL